MRDLLNILDYNNLTESRGLGARRSGEEFVSNTNPEDKIYVDAVTFFPQGSGAFDNEIARNQALDQIKTNYPAINVIGKFGPRDLAFGVAVFTRGNEKLAFIKPFNSLAPDPTDNTWSNQKGIPGYHYNSKAAAKSQAGMTPQDILTQPSDLDAAGVLDQIVAKFGAESPQAQAARLVASGADFPIEVQASEAESFTAFRDYFCELLHPIALQTGRYTGNAGAAAEKFLGGASFADCSINFGKDKTEGLSDSILIAPSGQKIKVSSKGATGADASVKNIVDAANEVANSNPDLLKKYKEVIELIREVVKAGQAGAPLVLGVKYGIIGAKDAEDIQNLKKLPNTTMSAVKEMKLSSRLKALISERETKNPDNLNLYFHSIAAVAHQAAEHVNKSTNFSKAASEILNNGALIQVYTKAEEKEGVWTISGFETLWPSTAVTGVAFKAGKNYMSTNIKGNFIFKILRNGAKDVEDESDEVGTEKTTTLAKQTAVVGGRVDIRPTRASTDKSTTDLGRSKRSKG